MSSVSVYRGTTKQINISLVDENGNALDLTNATVTLQLAADRNTPTADLAAAWSMTIVGDPTNGSVRRDLAPADTANLAAGTYEAQVKAVYADGTVWRTNLPFTFNVLDPVEAP